jgi:hypothetical protein
MFAALLGILGGCGDSSTTSGAYGGPQNHLHDLLALRGVPNTILLATHIGLYRSADSGKTWREVAGGAGQAMDGLMLYKLAQSPVDPQRVYLLAEPRPDNPKAARATSGIYTSADAGATWRLAAPVSAFDSRAIFSIGAGSGSPGQVYAIIPSLGSSGVYASNDAGATWQALPPVPVTLPSGVTGDAAHPGRLYLWSVSTGLFVSNDNGQTWAGAPGVSHGVFSVSLAGNNVYVSGDDGLYLSHDGGASFALANTQQSFTAVVACAATPNAAYAITGTTVYATTDGGATWKATTATSQHPGVITADPVRPSVAYAGFSYPVGVALTVNNGAVWRTVLP